MDTNPEMSGGEGLIVAVGITARVGRMRTWTVRVAWPHCFWSVMAPMS